MSERLKSHYLRKREEINSHPGRYFFAGFMFSFFLLFLFYQFRSMILQKAQSCEEQGQMQEVHDEPQPEMIEQPSKYINYTSVISDFEINQKDIKEIQNSADKLVGGSHKDQHPVAHAKKSPTQPDNFSEDIKRSAKPTMKGRKEELN